MNSRAVATEDHGVTVTRPPAAPRPPAPAPSRARRWDLAAATAAALLVAAAAGIGVALAAAGVPILLPAPPLLAEWMPHVGPGTVPAVLVAVLVVTGGPTVAQRLGGRTLLLVAYVASLAWTMSLALVDGFAAGFADRLTSVTEYLHEVPRITDIPVFLQRFTSLIPNGQPGFWTTHVAGHPPLATLVFVWLDRLGLGGGIPASTVVVLVGCSAPVAVAVTLRALDADALARRYLPFGVLFPGAVWVGVSADGMFAAVLAWGVALTALACARDAPGRRVGAALIGLAAGLVLGAALFLNYGFVVALTLPLAVVLLTRSWRPVLPAALGTGAVAAGFAAAGFWWLDGYHALVLRYSQPGEFGGLRPYSYFVWANLGALVLVVGLAAAVGIRRVLAGLPGRVREVRHDAGTSPELVLTALVVAALLAVAVADVSGMSKGEVERIWLPFAVWLVPAAALLPRSSVRWWLAAQAVLALAVNHLLFTTW